MMSETMTVGQLLSELRAVTEMEEGGSKTVWYDFVYQRVPNTESPRPILDSWRGSYDELALHYTNEGDACTVADLIDVLERAIGKEFHGYKGGTYRMDKNTPVWVSNWGEAAETGIVDVVETSSQVTLRTKDLDY